MPYDGDDRDWGDDNGDDWEEPPRETITHRHPSLPFIEITQTRYPEERTAEDDRFETWGFEILGPREAATAFTHFTHKTATSESVKVSIL